MEFKLILKQSVYEIITVVDSSNSYLLYKWFYVFLYTFDSLSSSVFRWLILLSQNLDAIKSQFNIFCCVIRIKDEKWTETKILPLVCRRHRHCISLWCHRIRWLIRIYICLLHLWSRSERHLLCGSCDDNWCC